MSETRLSNHAVRRAQAMQWLATQHMAEQLRTYADDLDERARVLRAELVQIERDAPRARAAARALHHSGRRPMHVRELEAEHELASETGSSLSERVAAAGAATLHEATLHVLSSTHPTAGELVDREIVHVSEGAA